MLLTDQWQVIATDGNILVQKSNKASVSLCYADQTPTVESTFGLDTRRVEPFPASEVSGRKLYARTSLPNQKCTLTIEKVSVVGTVSAQVSGADLVSVQYSSNTTLAADPDRKYFFILSVSGTTTILLGGGAGAIPVTDYFEPLVAPTGEIDIVTDGVVIVVEG